MIHRIQAPEIEIAQIHQINRNWFWNQNIQDFHIVDLAIRDMDEDRYIFPKIDQRIDLHGGFVLMKSNPREDWQRSIVEASKARLDISLVFPVRELSECYTKKF